MKVLAQSIHVTMRDDSVASIGLQTLLGFTQTPWGVYMGHFPEKPSFKTGHYVTWQFLAGAPDGPQRVDMTLRDRAFAVTAWSTSHDKLEDVLQRVRYLLHDMRGVTKPTQDCQLIGMKYEHSGPDLWNDEFKVYYRAEQYRAYYREDFATVSGGTFDE